MLFLVDDKDKTAVIVDLRPGTPSFAKGKINTLLIAYLVNSIAIMN